MTLLPDSKNSLTPYVINSMAIDFVINQQKIVHPQNIFNLTYYMYEIGVLRLGMMLQQCSILPVLMNSMNY